MEQRSLRVVETDKTFFSKLSSTISKILIPTRVGLNGVMISIKRNSLIKESCEGSKVVLPPPKICYTKIFSRNDSS